MSESIRVECSVKFEDEWRQEECHWLYNRFFRLAWTVREKVADACKAKEFYYRFGPYSTNYNDYKRIYANETTNKVIGAGTQRWTHFLNFNTLTNSELRELESTGCVTVYIKAQDNDGVVYTAHDTIEYSLELPPDPSINVTIQKTASDYVICSWDRAEESIEASPVAGYAVDLLHCPKGETKFNHIKGIEKEVDDEGKIKLVKLPDSTNTEIYLESPELTSVYFSPKAFGFDKRDRYKFIIYPYTHYEGALLSTIGIESDTNEFTLGIVRVKTESGWQEGQVWVKTHKGWQEAEAVYTKTANGWKESI